MNDALFRRPDELAIHYDGLRIPPRAQCPRRADGTLNPTATCCSLIQCPRRQADRVD